MKPMWKRVICYFIIVLFVTGMGQYTPDVVKADTAVKVYIVQKEGTLNHAEHRTMTVGETRDGWNIELTMERTVKSAAWSTTDTTVATVAGNESSAIVTAKKEGTCKLKLSVTTNKGETVSNECILSVVTKLESDKQAAGYVKDKATFYRGASTASTIRNTASSGQKLTVIAFCGDFYRVRLPESYDFQDELNQYTTYALKSQIEIPVTSVSITNADTAGNMKVGESKKLEYTTLPEIATIKNVSWSSSDPKVATVNDDGKITAVRSGTAQITVTDKISGNRDKISVTVSDIFLTSLKIVNGDITHNLEVGETAELNTEWEPSNVTKKELIWKSSDPNVLTVSNTGKIKAIKPGYVKVTVSDRYSGQEGTAKVCVYYHLSAKKQQAMTAHKPKVRIKTATDFRGIYLQWNKIKGAKYYKLYREHWNKKKGRYVKTYKNGRWLKARDYTDNAVEKNKKYKYYVVAYKTKKRALTDGAKKAKKIKVKATAPTLTAASYTTNSIELNWRAGIAGKTKGIKGYIVTRYKKKNGKADKVWKKGKKIYQMTDKGLASGAAYSYTVCAYRKKKKKTYRGAYSNIASAATISPAKNITYFSKTANQWQGIYMEGKKRTESESTNIMRNYSVTVDAGDKRTETVFPYLKFHFAGDTLYIHLYVCYLKHSDDTGREEAVSDQKVIYGDRVTGGSYKEEFINGVTSIYTTQIVGNKYDFEKGVKFNTKMVLHEIDKESYASGQQFLRVSLGGECPDQHTGEDAWLENWPHCSGEPSGCPYRLERMKKRENRSDDYALISDKVLHMPDINRMVFSKGKIVPSYSLEDYRTTCAHELGHILGLADGYELDDNYNNHLIRMTYTDETCYLYNSSKKEWANIMISQFVYPYIRANDMEMILTAYSRGMGPNDKSETMQYYKDYTQKIKDGNLTYSKSDVIKKKEGEK